MTIYSPHFLIDVKRGAIPGVDSINKFGANVDVDTVDIPETVWSQGGLWVPPTAARIHDVVSTDGADAAAGTGLRTVRLYGLDANFDELTEDITLDGTNNVATTQAFTRIFRMSGLTAGSGKKNAGVVTATAQTDSTVTAAIPAGASTTHMAVWTVPRLKTALIVSAFGAINRPGATAGAMVEFDLVVTSGISGSEPVEVIAQDFSLAIEGTSGINYVWPLPKRVDGPADIRVDINYSTDNNVNVAAGFDAIYMNTV